MCDAGKMWLAFLLVLGVALQSPAPLAAEDRVVIGEQAITVDAAAAAAYVQACRKTNGAFGPADQEYTDAAWNYPAVATLHLLGQASIDQADAILQHGLGFPTGHAGVAHWHLFHQACLQAALNAAVNPHPQRPPLVKLIRQTGELQYYASPLGPDQKPLYQLNAAEFLKDTQQATELWYYNLSSLSLTLAALDARGQKVANREELIAFIVRQQTPSGGFADVRDDAARPAEADARAGITFQVVRALKLLGAEVPHAADCIKFLQNCQTESGAFRAHPSRAFPGNSEDIYYTWAAVSALKQLDAQANDPQKCEQWINSLQNADGGFGDQPGWRSRLYSTYYAVSTLATLTGDANTAIRRKQVAQLEKIVIPEGKFQIYQGVNKIPVITPADLRSLAARKLNLLALKSDKFELAETLNKAIASQGLPQDAVLCLEAYPHRALRFGGVKLNHLANVTLDPRWTAVQQKVWSDANQAGTQALPWQKYQDQLLKPIQQLGARIYPEQDFEMDHAYEAYDAGVHGLEGYQAVLAGFNWVPRDFIRVFPWRERYVDKLTPIADCDAHGDLVKWSPQLDYTRHLYLAQGPGYAEFLKASEAGRVVCVIISPAGPAAGITYYGPAASVDYVKKHRSDWQWWVED